MSNEYLFIDTNYHSSSSSSSLSVSSSQSSSSINLFHLFLLLNNIDFFVMIRDSNKPYVDVLS